MTSPIPNCPQPETPIRERAWTDEQIEAMVQTFQIAEMEYAEKMAARGYPFDPALSVEYALRIVLTDIGATP